MRFRRHLYVDEANSTACSQTERSNKNLQKISNFKELWLTPKPPLYYFSGLPSWQFSQLPAKPVARAQNERTTLLMRNLLLRIHLNYVRLPTTREESALNHKTVLDVRVTPNARCPTAHMIHFAAKLNGTGSAPKMPPKDSNVPVLDLSFRSSHRIHSLTIITFSATMKRMKLISWRVQMEKCFKRMEIILDDVSS